MSDIFSEMAICTACNYYNDDYPPLVPARLSKKVKVMFIGENPSWEFGQRVPFDTITHSGQALHKNYLLPLKHKYNMKEIDIWVTDLFKCRYPKGIKKAIVQDDILNNAKTCAEKWLISEINLVKPQIIVSLGDKEVYQRLRIIFNLDCTSIFKIAAYRNHFVSFCGHPCKLIPACHPDVSFINNRKPIPSKKWSEIHRKHFVRTIGMALQS